MVHSGAIDPSKCDTSPEPGTIVLVNLTNSLAVPKSLEIDTLGVTQGLAADPTGNRIFFVHTKRVDCYKVRKNTEYTLFQPEVVVFDLLTEEIKGRIHLEQDELSTLNRYSNVNLPVATYDLALTPDGNTLLVVGTGKVYFLE